MMMEGLISPAGRGGRASGVINLFLLATSLQQGSYKITTSIYKGVEK